MDKCSTGAHSHRQELALSLVRIYGYKTESTSVMFEQLGGQHRRALGWFLDQTNVEIDWPMPLGGMFLANKAKGIHKPAGLEYALSIRQTMDGPYSDNLIQGPQSNWTLKYAQEGSDADYFTNRSLFACMRDEVPVGVFLQKAKKPRPRYQVLGLGKVVNWENGIFEVHSLEHTATTPITVRDFREFDPKANLDNRRRAIRILVMRQGQPEFRSCLLQAYQNRCAITNCAVISVLEAAHILGYRGIQTNHVQNGLLLRADLHSLFDLGLLHVEPQSYRTQLDEALRETEYWSLHGERIRLPSEKSQWPSRHALEARLLSFKNTN